MVQKKVDVIFCVVMLPPQAVFQAALLAEFTRIRAGGMSANEAAALALKALHERSPELVAARG